jgi:hypothetical protein
MLIKSRSVLQQGQDLYNFNNCLLSRGVPVMLIKSRSVLQQGQDLYNFNNCLLSRGVYRVYLYQRFELFEYTNRVRYGNFAMILTRVTTRTPPGTETSSVQYKQRKQAAKHENESSCCSFDRSLVRGTYSTFFEQTKLFR